MTILILGLGNPILTDDRVGLEVVETVRELLLKDSRWVLIEEAETKAAGVSPVRFSPVSLGSAGDLGPCVVELDQDTRGGLALMERLVGYERVILVDAILRGGKPGTVYRLSLAECPTQRTRGTHDVQLATALQLGQMAGYQVPAPEQVHVVAVEAEDVLTFGEECTTAVREAVPRAASLVVQVLHQIVSENL
jgi:hydrogenase maturation protease